MWRSRAIGGMRRGDDRDVARRPRQRRRGQLDPLLELHLDLAELVADHDLLAGGQLDVAHQVVDEVAVAVIGRNPAAGGVQVLQIAERLQLGHLVADRRRGDADPGISPSVLELTGRPVATYSRTTSRRIIRCRSDTDASSLTDLGLEDRIVSSLTPCSWEESLALSAGEC